MAYNRIETVLALECLRAPLNPNPMTARKTFIHQMQIKYRTYFIEYNVLDSAVMLPRMFYDDFGNEMPRVANVCDVNGNDFEVLVDKINGSLYFTRGWGCIRDFYDIRAGAWLVLVYTGVGRFSITIQDRIHEPLPPPIYTPPAKFIMHKEYLTPFFVNDLSPTIELLAYSHPQSCFHFSYEKVLTHHDISSGFLILPYDGFGEHAFDATTTSIKLVDDCGYEWICDLIFVTFPCNHLRIGGEWSKMVSFRKLNVGEVVRAGVKEGGNREVLYIDF